MLIRYIFKNIRRSAVTNALFCVLLALAGALFALSAGLWYSVYRTGQDLDDIITTIAMYDVQIVRRQARIIAREIVDGSRYIDAYKTEPWWTDGWRSEVIELRAKHADNAVPYIQDCTQKWIDIYVRADDVYDGLPETDERRVYGAYVSGLASVPYQIAEHGRTDALVENAPQSIAAFVVKCTGADVLYDMKDKSLFRSVVAHFEVEQEVYLHSGRRSTRTVTGYFPYANPDGSAPVEEGKRYLVVGYNYSQGDSDPTWQTAISVRMYNAIYMDILSEKPAAVTADTVSLWGESGFNDTATWLINEYGYDMGDFPVPIRALAPKPDKELGYEGYTWFELEGSLEDAFASPQGEHIKTALRVAEVSVNSLTVITTNELNSLFGFNQYRNRIVSGRKFDAGEISGGAHVCVISAQLAEINGLGVGDKLPMSLYPTSLGEVPESSGSAWLPNPYHPSLPLTEPVEYTIIGIYSGPVLGVGDHEITANTVFVPAASFGGFDDYVPYERLGSLIDPPLLNTIIVPNGEVKETKASIDSIADGRSGYFRFYDQGYSRLRSVLAKLHTSMAWILTLAAAGWAVAVVIFVLFYVRRKKDETALLYRVGVSKRRSTLWVFTQCAAIIVLAQGIAISATLPFFNSIRDAAVSASWAFTEGYRDYTLSNMDIAGGVRIMLPISDSALGLTLVAAGAAALLLVVSAIQSARLARKCGI